MKCINPATAEIIDLVGRQAKVIILLKLMSHKF